MFVIYPITLLLQAYGMTNVDMTQLTAKELMAWGLTNLWKEGEEGGYGIYWGNQLVPDFPNPESPYNFFEKDFPVLFLYGCGGIEAKHPVKVDFMHDICWMLQYCDHQFWLDSSFPFMAFGIWQHCQVLGSAQVEMNWHDFEWDAGLFGMIT